VEAEQTRGQLGQRLLLVVVLVAAVGLREVVRCQAAVQEESRAAVRGLAA